LPNELRAAKREVALLDDRKRGELISFTLQLRYAHDANYRREVNDAKRSTNPTGSRQNEFDACPRARFKIELFCPARAR
jgi:hypothetical protein